jgi:AcrR family transcriptional regulator
MSRDASSEKPAVARLRRRPGELRPDIVQGATRLFLERGYDGTSMRDIAAAAGTTQAMLYRHFPTKAALFRETVVEPFHRFVEEFVSEMRTRSSADLPSRELMIRFTQAILDLSTENRRLLLALVSALAFSPDALDGPRDGAPSALADLISELQREYDDRGWDLTTIPVAVRASVAMILGVSLFGEWLFPAGETDPSRPERAALVVKLADFQLASFSVHESEAGAP